MKQGYCGLWGYLLFCLIIGVNTSLVCMSFVSPVNVGKQEQESRLEKTFFEYVFNQIDYLINNSGAYGLVGSIDPQFILVLQQISKDERMLYNFRVAFLKRYNFLWRFTHLLHTWDFNGKSVYSLSFSRSGNNLAVGLFKGMNVITAPYAHGSHVTSFYQGTGSIHKANFSPRDEHLLAVTSSGTVITLWDIRNNKTPRKNFSIENKNIYSFAYAANGESIVAGTLSGKVYSIDLAKGITKFAPVSHDGWVMSVLSRPGDGCVVSGGEDRRVMFWNPQNDDTLRFFAHNAAVSSTSCMPGSQYFISAGWDRHINIWDGFTGDCIKTIKAHDDWVMSIKSLLDGLFLVSGATDGNLKVWSIPQGEELALLKRHPGSILSLAVSPDGKLIASGCDSGLVKMWKTPMDFAPEELVLLVLINHTIMCDMSEWNNYWKKVYASLPALVVRKVNKDLFNEYFDGLPAFFRSKKRASWGKKIRRKKLRTQKMMRNFLRQKIKTVS